ncbi:NADH-dependent [FeFe] hydrogenase, group A6 [Oceanirhabdus sp. W0125-5]|uniref:NADH-dependent [FeFe] hydrogenase, group A6 n=1 Tax=Oceanirhabdus sp. W0125-5 TaxID=2999116 RepID=UPI0022F2F49F|nr:NADH-dependent [FeFe] hydrogenase, group A6 [Oceanirhabdus sp. W0125-5]WBW95746.1 NADH-dependent [FeFe] hydrogenase, group A6 [Oceanirhabdus sp. W0125-5]
MEMVSLTIDGIKVEVEKGTTVLEAAKKVGIKIPTLCYFKDINKPSSCRVCVVEVGPRLLASCSLEATEGMDVKTNTRKVREARKTVIQLTLSNHKRECLSCSRNGNCELQTLAEEYNIRDVEYEGEIAPSDIDDLSCSIVRDNEKCVACGRCISVCSNVQTVSAIGWSQRGFDTRVTAPYGRALSETNCVNCGQCIMVCPVAALQEKENIQDVWNAIDDENKVVVVQTAPAVRVGLGEEFDLSVGERVTGKMVAALRRLGFDKVFDTDFAADLTIMEEGTELLTRVSKGEKLPLMTSCCPGWIKFVEHNYPEMLENLSTCKSPQQMMGAVIKSYFAKEMGIDAKNIYVVSVMPCVAKKFEGDREELSNEGLQDVDAVLTTRELAQMIKEMGVDFANLAEEDFDHPLGESTGAGVIFGATGGVAEAALRTVYEVLAEKELDQIEYEAVRGIEGVKEAALELPNGQTLNAVIAHGLANARKVIESIKSGEKSYDFIEVMACPGGCVNGGGQPIVKAQLRDEVDAKVARAKGLYSEDKALPIRKSHKNEAVQKLYKDFLGEPNGHLAHELLHTHYVKRDKF